MPDTAMLVSGRQVISDPERAPLPAAAVLVRGDAILAVGPTMELAAAAPSAQRLDFPDATILPGLINAHLHLCFDVTTDPRVALEAHDLGAVRATIARNARTVLDGGVTTARDLGDLGGLVAQFREQVDDGMALGPDLLTARSPLTPPGGHCWFLDGELDTTPTGAIQARRIITEAIERLAEQGADVVKVMASGGNLTPAGAPMWKSQFSQHDLDLIVAAAHERGLPVAGHAHGTDAMARCARAGVDTIEHGSWRGEPGPDGALTYDCSEGVAELIAASGAAIVPTRSRGWTTWPPEAQLEVQLAHLAWADQHGITMIAGNDAGVGQGRFDDLVDAISLFGAAGWTPQRALAAATTRAAAVLGQDQRIGRLAPGYRADLLITDRDPLTDLRALRTVRSVIAGGREHRPTPHPRPEDLDPPARA